MGIVLGRRGIEGSMAHRRCLGRCRLGGMDRVGVKEEASRGRMRGRCWRR